MQEVPEVSEDSILAGSGGQTMDNVGSLVSVRSHSVRILKRTLDMYPMNRPSENVAYILCLGWEPVHCHPANADPPSTILHPGGVPP